MFRNLKKNHDNWLRNKKKLFKVKKCLKNAQKLKIFSLKIHKCTGIFENSQNLIK